jgi:hypothetical protein
VVLVLILVLSIALDLAWSRMRGSRPDPTPSTAA